MSSSRPKIGRPKKNISIDPSQYHKIVTVPKVKTSVVEFSNTEPFDMSKYLKTLKSNGITEFYIDCLPTRVIFWGKTITKHYSEEFTSGEKDYMFLFYECDMVFRYFCKRPTFICIDDKESIISLLGEISESSKKIKMTVDSNMGDYVNFTITNKTLKSKNRFSINCTIEFDSPTKIMTRPIIPQGIKYCEITDIDISEYKKELNSKFKKKVTDSKILFSKDQIEINFTTGSKSMKTTYEVDNYLIKVFVDRLVEMNYPKNNIIEFLLHIKGKFTIRFSKEYILLVYNENGALLISMIGT